MKSTKNKRGDALDDYVQKNLPTLSLLKSLLPYQLDLVLSEQSHETVIATRRAGKTTGCLAALLYKCLKQPSATCHYLAMTRSSAKRIAWTELKKMCEEHGITAEFSEGELCATFPNRSRLYLAGINGEHLLDSLRGTPIDALVLDEAASYRGSVVQSLIEEVAEPALGDRNGRLMVVGTPGPLPNGFFYDATTGRMPEWNIRRWSVLENTHFAQGNAAKWLAEHKAKKGWNDDHPVFRREYKGEWVLDTNALVYKFDRHRNIGQPTYPLTHHVLAVDLGFRDATAYVVIGYNPSKGRAKFVVHNEAQSGCDITTIKTKLVALQARFKPHHTLVDEGGLGKLIAEEWRRKDGISCEAAVKSDKVGWIELLNGELMSGMLNVTNEAFPLVAEMENLPWDSDNAGKESPNFDNHSTDATLYAFRKIYNFVEQVIDKKHMSEEDLIKQAFARMDERAMAAEAGDWWEA